MQITNCGRGIHKREVKGIDQLRKSLPSEWYAFTNLDLALSAGRAREIDVILVSPRRVFVIDIKDWHGQISSADGRWLLNGVDKDGSPVQKVNDTARSLYILLKGEMARRPETQVLPVPRVEGIVLLTGNADQTNIAATERSKVFPLGTFVSTITNVKLERTSFGNIPEHIVNHPLTEPSWKSLLSRFLNAGVKSPLKPGRRKFQRYVADEYTTFAHPNNIYKEYNAVEDGTPPSLGTLRLWDFTKIADTRFQTEDGRREIAGRERQVFHWIRDRNEVVEQYLLTPRLDDPECGTDYWEIYDRRRRLKRLSDFSDAETNYSPAELIELARQLLSAIAQLHQSSAAHLDIGAHSIWLEAPTTIRLSHLFAARFPDIQSLGEARYHFLASVGVPEDILGGSSEPHRRDVYLAGVAVHHILLGQPPAGEPPEWNPDLDTEGRFALLHHWLAEALEIDSAKRFADARVALDAFNRATVEHPTHQEVISGLEKFRGKIRSQLALLTAFPIVGSPIRETDRCDSWMSRKDEIEVIVKMWKHGAWGDLRKEGARLLSFMERASEIRADSPGDIPRIYDILWLGDAVAITQELVKGDTLSDVIGKTTESTDPLSALSLMKRLLGSIDRLHERNFGHGDLKPEHIIIREAGDVCVIDSIDFSSSADGEMTNSAYSNGGDRFVRDRFAILKIAEELFSNVMFSKQQAVDLARAIEVCRTKEPRLSTLLPLADALDQVIRSMSDVKMTETSKTLSLSIRGSEIGVVEPDEGRYYIRSYAASDRKAATTFVRGATEEIEFRLNDHGRPLFAIRRSITQTRISIIARHESSSFVGRIEVVSSELNDFSDAEALIAESHPVSASIVDSSESAVNEEEVEEVLEEETSEHSEEHEVVDVPLLWKQLIETEKELTTEGTAQSDAILDRAINRYRAAFELDSGVFDFDRNDTVAVYRFTKGGWRRLGELDVARSHVTSVVIDVSRAEAPARSRIFEAGQRLRFISHFEAESLRRRSDAVSRILTDDGRTKYLVSAFDPRSMVVPKLVDHEVKEKDLSLYNLNSDQLDAFRKIVAVRPLGLLQGPPGTGKTRFIAALAHYALTQGLARNVLLSSQSHEAVNTAAEALLKLFRQTRREPSILRVAMNDDQVSDPIRPYHTRKVEQALKDKFQAAFKDRVELMGKELGLGNKAVDGLMLFETGLRPLASRIAELQSTEDSDRLRGLRRSLESIMSRLELREELLEAIELDVQDFLQNSFNELAERYSQRVKNGTDKCAKLASVIKLGRDFLESASRQQRSFEPFLAGTRQIVVGTCVGLGRSSLGLTATAFDLVIVDEAARCTASELLVPLQVARWAVLVGDQAQLKPQHRAEVVETVSVRTAISKKEIQRSDFERVFSTAYGKAAGARLHTQYRMLEPIGKLVSEAFYPEVNLRAGREDRIVPPSALPDDLSLPLVWIETDSEGEAAFDRREGENGSRINRLEADVVVKALEKWLAIEGFREWLTSYAGDSAGIGIICMYAAQRDLIHRKLLRSPLAEYLGQQIKVGTVDSYQGKENPIVLLSLVRNNADGAQQRGLPTIREGFLASPNRINVAVSRAMDRLVVVGSRGRWRNGGPMSRLAVGFDQSMSKKLATLVAVRKILQTAKHGEKGRE